MTAHVLSAPRINPLAGIRHVLSAVHDVLESYSRSQAAFHVYQALSAMSDDELTRRGLSREDIPTIVQRVLTA